MHYNLRGKIAKAHPYQLDKTLTVEGAGAESESTGKAIGAVRKIAEDHAKDNANPHKVTKKQVGLDNVDNTADVDKPVSTLQAEAIAEAKKAGTDAMAEAEKKTEKIPESITLPAAGWVENKQTVEVPGVTLENDVIIGTNPVNATEYAESFILCTEQDVNSLTFTCENVPEKDLLVNVLILN